MKLILHTLAFFLALTTLFAAPIHVKVQHEVGHSLPHDSSVVAHHHDDALLFNNDEDLEGRPLPDDTPEERSLYWDDLEERSLFDDQDLERRGKLKEKWNNIKHVVKGKIRKIFHPYGKITPFPLDAQ